MTIVRELAISINNLSKTYPVPFRRLRAFFRRPVKEPVEALRKVTFDVYGGEIFGLIGRNGAGKTTLTKIVATLVQPTRGTVTVHNNDSVLDDEQVRKQIGLATAEERSFYWRLTGEQNLMFFARLHGLSDRIAKQRIRELFGKLELEEVARRRFGEMSTGNKQRLAVARAMLSQPPVLLLDEPTRSLDPLAAARMRELISSLGKQDPPVTILLTSHNLAEVETLCERVAIISRGRIRAIDTPQHLRSLTSKSEQVHVTVAGLNGTHESEKISFTRQSGDNQLDERLRDLQKRGARILDVAVERATLFDVLELYESSDTDKH
ncbi:MAG TPA: ABC transporter ATP-binding protein [Pyrinomonadaceae bacterium]|nr:ABC transporter ATP-binding protein [Pyrinomonadaceae bacterium]